jgi:aspartate kinase
MLIVQKFGGTSMQSIHNIKTFCNLVKTKIESGNKVVVIVSAQFGETDRLINLFNETTEGKPQDKTLLAERDAIISTGEQVCAGLFASCLNIIGIKSRSFNGIQAGIFTDGKFSRAHITELNLNEVEDALKQGVTPVITGFQGFCLEEKRQTTLGRGGSDTSAIAISAKLNADVCEIYKDVEGILTGDPKMIDGVKKIDSISYQSILELSSAGAKVLETRAVNFALKYKVPISIISNSHYIEGTKIQAKVNEKAGISGVSFKSNDLLYSFTSSLSVSDEFERLNNLFINYKLLSIDNGRFNVLISKAEGIKVEGAIQVSVISIVGCFLKSDNVLERAIKIINTMPILTTVSEGQISVVIKDEISKNLANAIHNEFL